MGHELVDLPLTSNEHMLHHPRNARECQEKATAEGRVVPAQDVSSDRSSAMYHATAYRPGSFVSDNVARDASLTAGSWHLALSGLRPRRVKVYCSRTVVRPFARGEQPDRSGWPRCSTRDNAAFWDEIGNLRLTLTKDPPGTLVGASGLPEPRQLSGMRRRQPAPHDPSRNVTATWVDRNSSST